MNIGGNSPRLHHMFTWASNERRSSPFESYEMRIGRQHISQSSTYCCRDTLKSNSIVIGCQQYGQSNSYSISMALVYTYLPSVRSAMKFSPEMLAYFFHRIILQRMNILPTTINNMYSAVPQLGTAVGAGAKTVSPPPFFPKLSNIGQRFIPNWPIIRKFNQRSTRSSRKDAIA